ncbi:MAG: amino acid adenylation domain-containing protein [Anaerolineae bacterium]|nr:amino acid adenylation domain-containing protein [Anaerolineae bacterium]
MSYNAIYQLTQAITLGAERHPDKAAVRRSGKGLTYAELETKSNQLAHLLRELGVKKGDRVGFYLNKSLETIIGVYGIMKAGAAYVPLDPFAPAPRLTFVMRNCGIRHLITSEMKLDGVAEMLALDAGLECLIGVSPLPDTAVRTLTWDEVFTMPTTLPTVGIIEQDLAYILYTSGSTGDPKGIMHTHRSALSFAEWAAETYGLQEQDVLSNHAPMHFDLSTFDFFAGALVGATTVIIPEALTKFPANLTRLIESERISVWYSVPYALIQMLTHGNLDKHDLSSLRWLLFAGEVFPTKHLRVLMTKLPEVRFSNLYGPTETNVCTFYHVTAQSGFGFAVPPDTDEPIPIGAVCANDEGLIVDADNQPVAPGEVGELLIRGGTVMRGYWGRPDLNDKGFYRRPVFGEAYEDVYYRTGDLVQELPDGNLKYLGRKDRQIKTRGYRVELDEIEVALLSYVGVEEAAVYPMPDGEGSNLIEAAVTAKEGVVLEVAALIEHISAKLPPYAIPEKIWTLDSFPRTSTGKINRRELQTWAVTAVQN